MKLKRITTAAGILLASGLLVTGCANPVESLMENILDKAVANSGGQTSDDSTSQQDDDAGSGGTTQIDGLGTAEIPDDFPKSVPLPDLKPYNAVGMTIDGQRSWMIQYQGNFDDAIFDAMIADLKANGFNEDESSNLQDVMRIALFTDAEFYVNVSMMGPPDEDRLMQIMVAQNQDD